MGRLRSVLFLAVLTLMPLPCAAGPADDASVVVERWVTAFNSNDVDALVSLYAPNAILVGSTGLVLKEGREAIRGYFARLAKSGDKVVFGDRKIIVLDDNVAYATGFYEFSAVETARRKNLGLDLAWFWSSMLMTG